MKYYNLVKKERCPNDNHGPTFMSNMQQRSIVKIQQVSEKHRQKYNNCQTLQYRPLPNWHPTTVDLRGIGGAGGGGGLFPLLQVPVVHGREIIAIVVHGHIRIGVARTPMAVAVVGAQASVVFVGTSLDDLRDAHGLNTTEQRKNRQNREDNSREDSSREDSSREGSREDSRDSEKTANKSTEGTENNVKGVSF